MLAWMALPLSGCVIHDSPAPGCVETIGFPAAGGCFGKTGILDLQVEPEIACLDIEANNCNGGILEVRNTCAEALILDGITIQPSDSVGLDITKDSQGAYALVEVWSNFSDYIPQADERIELSGRLGEQAIQMTLIKSGPLCE